MQSFKYRYLLFFAAVMLVLKPFIGFNIKKHHGNVKHSTILVKAFTKRKLEFIKGGQFDVTTAQRRLADPAIHIVYTLPFNLSQVPGLVNPFFSFRYPVDSDIPGPPSRLYLFNKKFNI